MDDCVRIVVVVPEEPRVPVVVPDVVVEVGLVETVDPLEPFGFFVFSESFEPSGFTEIGSSTWLMTPTHWPNVFIFLIYGTCLIIQVSFR